MDLGRKAIDHLTHASELQPRCTSRRACSNERGAVVLGSDQLDPELLQRAAFNLADALFGDAELRAERFQECNWLQAMEGGIDSSRVSWLHRDNINRDPLFKGA